MRRVLPMTLALLLMTVLFNARAQTAEELGAKNAQQARAVLDEMAAALGGQRWLNQKNRLCQGRVAAFYHGYAAGNTTELWEFHAWPDQDRIEFGKHRDTVQFYLGRQGWEVTFKGKATLPQEQVNDYLRCRDHSIETVFRSWLNAPRTILIYEGQHLVDRHQADQVTVVSPQNDSVTIQIDAQTHLPLSRSFQWRDPVFKDENREAEEYDDYQMIDGFPTPLLITRFKNDEVIRQYYLSHVSYNQQLPSDLWSVEAAAKHIK